MPASRPPPRIPPVPPAAAPPSAEAPPRWRRRKDARPQEIAAAALDLFAERGFAATRLDAVAARAGVSKGTLYLYFPTKEELFKAVVRAAILPGIETAERLAVDAPVPSAELLRRLVGAVAGRILSSPAGVIPKLVIAEAGTFPDLARFYMDEVVQRALAAIVRILERGVARGEFRPLDAAATAPLVVAPLLLSALWTHVLGPASGRPLDVAALVEAHLDTLLRGLAADRPPPTPRGGTSWAG